MGVNDMIHIVIPVVDSSRELRQCHYCAPKANFIDGQMEKSVEIKAD